MTATAWGLWRTLGAPGLIDASAGKLVRAAAGVVRRDRGRWRRRTGRPPVLKLRSAERRATTAAPRFPASGQRCKITGGYGDAIARVVRSSGGGRQAIR